MCVAFKDATLGLGFVTSEQPTITGLVVLPQGATEISRVRGTRDAVQLWKMGFEQGWHAKAVDT